MTPPTPTSRGGGALNGLTTKLMNMYSSLTFEQEILGEAAADKDDGVEAEPGDNDHSDDDDDDDDDDDGDGGGSPGPPVGLNMGRDRYATWITYTSGWRGRQTVDVRGSAGRCVRGVLSSLRRPRSGN